MVVGRCDGCPCTRSSCAGGGEAGEIRLRCGDRQGWSPRRPGGRCALRPIGGEIPGRSEDPAPAGAVSGNGVPFCIGAGDGAGARPNDGRGCKRGQGARAHLFALARVTAIANLPWLCSRIGCTRRGRPDRLIRSVHCAAWRRSAPLPVPHARPAGCLPHPRGG